MVEGRVLGEFAKDRLNMEEGPSSPPACAAIGSFISSHALSLIWISLPSSALPSSEIAHAAPVFPKPGRSLPSSTLTLVTCVSRATSAPRPCGSALLTSDPER